MRSAIAKQMWRATRALLVRRTTACWQPPRFLPRRRCCRRQPPHFFLVLAFLPLALVAAWPPGASSWMSCGDPHLLSRLVFHALRSCRRRLETPRSARMRGRACTLGCACEEQLAKLDQTDVESHKKLLMSINQAPWVRPGGLVTAALCRRR